MKDFWKALGKAAAYALFFLAVQTLVAVLVPAIYGAAEGFRRLADSGEFMTLGEMTEVISRFVQENSTLLLALSNALLVLLLWLFFRLRKKRLFEEVELRKLRPRELLLPVACAVAFALVVGCGIALLPFSEEAVSEYEELAGLTLGGTGIIAFLSTVVFAPVAEELLFRGLVYTRLRRAMPALWACLIESAIFGAMHAALIWIVYAAVLAIIMTFIFEKYRSLFSSIVFHVAINFFGAYILPRLPLSTELANWVVLGVSLPVAAVLLVLISRRASAKNQDNA